MSQDTQKDAAPPIHYDGIPFIIRGKKIMECHQGKDRSKKKKESAQLIRNQETDHDYRKKRNLLQPTKKKNCPAMIRIRHIVKFTDFKLQDNTAYGRERMSIQIHDAVDRKKNLDQLELKHVYLISIPDISYHKNHFTGEIGSLVQPIDDRIKKYIKKTVAESNITSSMQMKLLLDNHIKHELFKDSQMPSAINSRFWPSLKVIRNYILLGLMEIRNSNVDQDTENIFFLYAELCTNPNYNLFKFFKGFWKNYKVGQQQDAHELLHMMMEEIQQKCFGSEDICNEKRVFYGKEKSVVICNGCQAKSSRSDVFSAISVSIEKHQNITQAIEGYFKEEEVEWKCDFCKKRTWAVKKTTLEEIPKNIVVQLQRFGGDGRKIMKKVDLHFDIYLRKYVEEHKVLEDKARLFGVIVNKGNTLTNGHYYAFIQFGTKWYLFDDLKVKQVSIQSLKDIEGQPYLLFYRALPRPYIS